MVGCNYQGFTFYFFIFVKGVSHFPAFLDTRKFSQSDSQVPLEDVHGLSWVPAMKAHGEKTKKQQKTHKRTHKKSTRKHKTPPHNHITSLVEGRIKVYGPGKTAFMVLNKPCQKAPIITGRLKEGPQAHSAFCQLVAKRRTLMSWNVRVYNPRVGL